MKLGTISLAGNTVSLERYDQSDAPVLYQQLGCNPEMMRFTGWNPYASSESAEQLVAETIQSYEHGSTDYSWKIVREGSPVGIIGAYDFDRDENSIEVGYSIFQEHWGRGYASEALALACSHLLETEGLTCLKAWSASSNIGSKRVLEKAGFVQTGIEESALNVNGESFDQVFFEKRR